jgi:hypothetical protein
MIDPLSVRHEDLSFLVAFVIIAFVITFGVIYMKIRKGGKPPKDPHTVYGCSECTEYFTSPEVVLLHCQDVHNLSLSLDDCSLKLYNVTEKRYNEMLNDEIDLLAQITANSNEKSTRTGAKLSQDPLLDPVDVLKFTDSDDPDIVFQKLSVHLESPTGSKPLPGIFNVNVDGSQIRLIIALKLSNTPGNMTAISEFNSKIN